MATTYHHEHSCGIGKTVKLRNRNLEQGIQGYDFREGGIGVVIM
jgi:hypothetical protein